MWVIDLQSDQRRKVTETDDFEGTIHALTFANSDRWIIAGGRGDAVIIFDSLKTDRVGELPCSDTVLGVDMCANTEALAASSSDGNVTMWWSETGDVLQCTRPWHAPDPQRTPASCVRFDPQRNFVIAGYHDGRLRVWNLDDGQPADEVPLTSAQSVTMYTPPFQSISDWLREAQTVQPAGSSIR